jgi:hypothetical protein
VLPSIVAAGSTDAVARKLRRSICILPILLPISEIADTRDPKIIGYASTPEGVGFGTVALKSGV